MCLHCAVSCTVYIYFGASYGNHLLLLECNANKLLICALPSNLFEFLQLLTPLWYSRV